MNNCFNAAKKGNCGTVLISTGRSCYLSKAHFFSASSKLKSHEGFHNMKLFCKNMFIKITSRKWELSGTLLWRLAICCWNSSLVLVSVARYKKQNPWEPRWLTSEKHLSFHNYWKFPTPPPPQKKKRKQVMQVTLLLSLSCSFSQHYIHIF